MKMSGRNNFDFLDALSAVSFLIAVANYKENLGQTSVQEVAQDIMSSINGHLKEQDEKINKMYEYILRKEREENAKQ